MRDDEPKPTPNSEPAFDHLPQSSDALPQPNDLPPMVRQVPPGELPVRSSEPNPLLGPSLRVRARSTPGRGIFASFGWCLLFLLILCIGFMVGFVGYLGYAVSLIPGENRLKILEAEVEVFTKAPAEAPNILAAIGFGMGIAELATVLFSIVLLRVSIGREWTREIALRRSSFQHAVLAVVLLPGFIITSNLIGEALMAGMKADPVEENSAELMLKQAFQSWSVLFAVLVIGLGPGLGEEFFCRGFLARGLITRFGLVSGIVITSIFFGMMHGLPLQVLITGCMGVALHLTLWWSRSMWIPIFLHFGNNSIAVLLMLGKLKLIVPEGENADFTRLWLMCAGGVGMLATSGYLLFRSRATLLPIDPNAPMWNSWIPTVAHPPEGSNAVLVQPTIGLGGWFLVGLSVILFLSGAMGSIAFE
ncbi:CPBP family intramembrane glutamic endopeptidase [Tuwongella immobilis]|uniref:CAAX prenyl protease 2/Lysostaphin resistance protein A-like domain-containing protein n=1 Tax=Tuwongella immobilis TaxID=692036 RepID=A0A6C2YLK2_9BACT|nr:type II CAAX endopeptidase family protein [Tuwongella immobilis]VIP02003.1 abc-2 type transporter family protein : Putative metal-dependent membrane protease OS=Planctomyces maris DSM 8797 GN=PM8797T_29258 PE=4 SV=1: Abi [Tuwongella immobilis]VTS00096.1 abc-2 type transporter family protein : Putative metal-dependent membrane protease OS=Planctomyces maris DSM 8797 GN=PM8797T_29258 PE=4 SV=1: Abi [Tuwongella immobilis]